MAWQTAHGNRAFPKNFLKRPGVTVKRSLSLPASGSVRRAALSDPSLHRSYQYALLTLARGEVTDAPIQLRSWSSRTAPSGAHRQKFDFGYRRPRRWRSFNESLVRPITSLTCHLPPFFNRKSFWAGLTFYAPAGSIDGASHNPATCHEHEANNNTLIKH